MVITSVVSLDKKRSRVLLDQDLALVLYPGDLQQFHIEEGGELEEVQYRILVDTVLKPRARERVLRTLQLSDRTERELESLLKREGYPNEVTADAIAMVKRYHYIDDQAYGERYVEDKSRRKSRKQLIADMQKKGFSRELIDDLLEEHPIDEKEQIRVILEKKGYHPGDELDRQQYGKLAGMLARKGYSYDLISEALRAPETSFD
ncbi:MAG: regulatory protein RecX [Lachnospiraceae bacterium]|nr:regulatory protein RecX [Lachnospiraceae bacterium]